ncbi:2-oxoglutarate dehydrogenase, E2 component, dihydrolipoamide succinyltransferase [Wenjunlia vitaminophila]|uniref:2-oxoglutarate dehydrogenase, E2 component, dihydrolipoamide succinyltransferase n=1 Tax=Wenjunlia vitaminophila TaxID=76728 RepID=UPI000AA9238D|nr:2-oxoglutarate dehydrogenase, E2 component, dihydrolipoamide succinyltransferase [Wenjunlia vitaminophila]
MAVSVTLPALGESVSEGTVTRWLKAEGERVEADEPLLEVSTDKVDTEIPAPAAGVLASIKVAEDETVEVGAELAIIDDGSGAPAAAPAPAQEPTPEPAPAPAEAAPQQEAPAAAPQPAPQQEAPAGGAAEGTPVLLPALGESVTEGTVTRWLKQVGDEVAADEPLLEVSTDKVDTEIPAPAAGVLLQILISEDETAEVGTALAVIGAPGAPRPPSAPTRARPAAVRHPPAPAPAPAPRASSPPRPAPAPTPLRPAAAPPPPPPLRPRTAPAPTSPRWCASSPPSRASTWLVQGSGVGGRIRKHDVIAAAEARRAAAETRPAPAAKPAAAPVTPSPLRGQTLPMSRIRKAIAKHMVHSLQVSAQLTTVVEVDVTRVMQLRARARKSFLEREGVKLSPLPFFIKAATEALKVHPSVNARVNDDDTITYHDVENVGIAVDTEKGLFVPVLHNAGDLSIAGIAKRVADLAARTREGGLKPDEATGGTFTVTNTGSRGALFDTPILNQPQVGMLGVGATVRRPVVVNHPDLGETIAVRDMMYLALSYDHRIVDGADAARFLGTIKARLEEGAFEADLGL